MIFSRRSIRDIKSGRKNQTRRPVKPGEKFESLSSERLRLQSATDAIVSVVHNGRRKWRVFDNYAIQPGRGKKGVGFIQLVSIRIERVTDISLKDTKAEGFETREEFFEVWRGFYGNIEGDCWVLEFQYLGEANV